MERDVTYTESEGASKNITMRIVGHITTHYHQKIVCVYCNIKYMWHIGIACITL